jgi:hypothetical protein
MTVTSTTYAWREFDVTSHVRNARNAGRRLISFAFHASAPSIERLDMNSSEASSNRPELVLVP